MTPRIPADQLQDRQDDTTEIVRHELRLRGAEFEPPILVDKYATEDDMAPIAAQIRAALDSTRPLPEGASLEDQCRESLRSLLNDAFNEEQLGRIATLLELTAADTQEENIANIIDAVWADIVEEDPEPDRYMHLVTLLNTSTYPAVLPNHDLSLINWHMRNVGGGLFEPRLQALLALLTRAYEELHPDA